MYVSFTQYDGKVTFIYDTDLSTEDIKHLWSLTENINKIESRLNAIQEFSEAIYKRFERVEVESQFFT